MEREGRSLSLERKFDNWGIDDIFFDLDSTLVDTTNHYRDRIHKFCEFLVRKSRVERVVHHYPFEGGGEKIGQEISGELLFEKMWNTFGELRGEFQVRPAITEVCARGMAMIVDVNGDEFEKEIDGLMKIYETAPEVFPEAINQLRLVRETGRNMYVITHGDEKWTKQKLSRGMLDFFDGIAYTPVHLPKDTRAWIAAVDKFKTKIRLVLPERMMIVGDNWGSDIEPGLEMDVKVPVWVRNGAKPRNDPRVIEIETIADLVETLLMN